MVTHLAEEVVGSSLVSVATFDNSLFDQISGIKLCERPV